MSTSIIPKTIQALNFSSATDGSVLAFNATTGLWGGVNGNRSTVSNGIRGWSIVANPYPVYTVNGVMATGQTDINDISQTNGSQTGRYPVTFCDDAFDVRIVCGNFYWQDLQNILPGPISSKTFNGNPVTVAVALESPGGTIYPLTFGGAANYSIQPGEVVVSDPLPIAVVKSSVWYVRYFNGVPNGGFLWATVNSPSGMSYKGRFSTTDCTSSVSSYFTGSPDSPRPIMPCGIVGRSLNPGSQTPTIGVIGDSIAYGYGDTGGGWFNRAFGTANGIHFEAAQGQSAKYRASSPGHRSVLNPLISLCDYVIIALGTNDVTAHITTNHDATSNAIEMPTIQQSIVSLAQDCQAVGARPIAMCLFPLNTAATASTNPNWQLGRHALNTWLRTIPAPFLGVIDLSASLETSPVDVTGTNGSGQWLASLLSGDTTDSIHPGPVRSAAIATAFNTQFNAIVSMLNQY